MLTLPPLLARHGPSLRTFLWRLGFLNDQADMPGPLSKEQSKCWVPNLNPSYSLTHHQWAPRKNPFHRHSSQLPAPQAPATHCNRPTQRLEKNPSTDVFLTPTSMSHTPMSRCSRRVSTTLDRLTHVLCVSTHVRRLNPHVRCVPHPCPTRLTHVRRISPMIHRISPTSNQSHPRSDTSSPMSDYGANIPRA